MPQEIAIDPNGAEIKAEVRIGYAHEGAYVLTLWEGNSVKKRWEGNFIDPEDDTYTLPGTAGEQTGCLLQCRAEIGIVPGLWKWALLVTLWQGDQKIGSMTASGEAEDDDILVPINLFARLVEA